MSASYNKEWATGDIIEATDLNAITPFMFGLVYNETSDWDETTATVQQIMDGLSEHHVGLVVTYDAENIVYTCDIVLRLGFEERTGLYNMTLYGDYLGSVMTVNLVASSVDGKFHTVNAT